MLSHLKSAFCLLQCVDVRKGAVPLNNISFIITKGETAIQKPVIGSIIAPAAQFMLDGSSGGHCGPPIFQNPIKVFGMYCASPPPTRPLLSGKPRVVQPTLAHEVDGSIRQIGPHIGGDCLDKSPKLLLVAPDLLFRSFALRDVGHRSDKLAIPG